jgi:hypothetical protein
MPFLLSNGKRLNWFQFKVLQKLRGEVSILKVFVFEKLNVERYGRFNSLNDVFAQCAVHFLDAFFTCLCHHN